MGRRLLDEEWVDLHMVRSFMERLNIRARALFALRLGDGAFVAFSESNRPGGGSLPCASRCLRRRSSRSTCSADSLGSGSRRAPPGEGDDRPRRRDRGARQLARRGADRHIAGSVALGKTRLASEVVLAGGLRSVARCMLSVGIGHVRANVDSCGLTVRDQASNPAPRVTRRLVLD